jgi:redox-sensing transcriptional repressor
MASSRKPRSLPPSVVTRLTKYLSHVQGLCTGGVRWVSSHDLAQTLGLTSSTVRQDLSHVDFSGISKRGYEAEGLRKVLSGVLGADRTWKLVVIGAGNLGQALALHEEFHRRGFDIVAVFDSDPGKVGRKIGQLVVQGMRDLPRDMAARRVDIGLIAVPAAAAQSVADLLVMSGVRGILNLTLAHIVAPRRVPVIDTRIVAGLIELTHAIKQR